MRTNYGNLVEPQGDMDRTKIRSVGIGLIDRIPGPFELCIERIWVRTLMSATLCKEANRSRLPTIFRMQPEMFLPKSLGKPNLSLTQGEKPARDRPSAGGWFMFGMLIQLIQWIIIEIKI